MDKEKHLEPSYVCFILTGRVCVGFSEVGHYTPKGHSSISKGLACELLPLELLDMSQSLAVVCTGIDGVKATECHLAN